jgi:hypothetical protein
MDPGEDREIRRYIVVYEGDVDSHVETIFFTDGGTTQVGGLQANGWIGGGITRSIELKFRSITEGKKVNARLNQHECHVGRLPALSGAILEYEASDAIGLTNTSSCAERSNDCDIIGILGKMSIAVVEEGRLHTGVEMINE